MLRGEAEEEEEEREEEKKDEEEEREVGEVEEDDMRNNSLNLSVIAAQVIDDDDERLKLARDNTITNITGYMIRKLHGANKLCSDCTDALTGQFSDSADEVYISNKQYSDLKDKPGKGLTVSCSELRKAVSKLEDAYMQNTQLLVGRNIKGQLIPLMMDVLNRSDLDSCSSGKCERHSRLAHLYFNIRIHYTLKDSSNCFKKQIQSATTNS